MMLGEEAERPGWDLEGRFIPSNIQVYFEDKSQELVQVMIFLSSIHSFSLSLHIHLLLREGVKKKSIFF